MGALRPTPAPMSMGKRRNRNTKADGVKGSMEFTHNPRFYFNLLLFQLA